MPFAAFASGVVVAPFKPAGGGFNPLGRTGRALDARRSTGGLKPKLHPWVVASTRVMTHAGAHRVSRASDAADGDVVRGSHASSSVSLSPSLSRSAAAFVCASFTAGSAHAADQTVAGWLVSTDGLDASSVGGVGAAAGALLVLAAVVAGARSVLGDGGGRSGGGGGGASSSNVRKATSIPGATPRTRGTGASDDSKGRGYLIAPPPLFPLVPAFSRQTYRYEVEPGRMWFFEQKQGIGLGLNVSVNVRMTVIKLRSGGLWVHAPVAPTAECIALLEELNLPVEHIVLPTTLFEHKIFVGPFQRRYPDASVWIAPDQWSWPVNLPPTFFGIFKTGTLGVDPTPFDDEFEYELLSPPALGVASYVAFTECAFLHKDTKTLLVTDAVVYVSENIPDAIPDRDLMESGDDGNFTIAALKFLNLFDIATKAKQRTRTSADMTEAERKRLGWQRNALQALYFGPSNLLDPEESWQGIKDRLIVAPVVSTLVYENIPNEVRDWARRVGRWKFNRIVPAHLDAPIKAGPKEWNAAFGFLPSSRPEEAVGSGGKYYPNDDMVLLRGVEDFLQGSGVIFTDENRPKRNLGVISGTVSSKNAGK